MANRLDFFFRQRVRESDLDTAFELLEQADRDLARDVGIFGIVDGMLATQRDGVPDTSLTLTAPGRAYDQHGRRVFYGTAQVVDVSTDLNGVSTAVTNPGHEKIVGVYIGFDRALSDPRTDGNSQQVFFRRDESFRLVVRQGAEAPAGTATPPPYQPDELLVADVVRRHGQTQILNSDLRPNPLVPGDVGRRQRFVFAEADAVRVFTGGFQVLEPERPDAQSVCNAVDGAISDHVQGSAHQHQASHVRADMVAGVPHALPAGSVQEQITTLVEHSNNHANATATAHPATAVTYGGGPAWRDGTANSPGTVQSQLDGVIDSLSATGGSAKVGAAAVPGSPYALPAGSVQDQVAAANGHVNAHATATAGAHVASAVECAAGAAWRDGHPNPAATVQDQFDKVVTDLGAATPGADGADRVGAAAVTGVPHGLDAGSVRSQVGALLELINRTGLLDTANAWAAPQSYQGSDDNGVAPALSVDAPTSVRQLALDLRGGNYRIRLYYTPTGAEVTLNARWTGSGWTPDTEDVGYTRFVIDRDYAQFAQLDPEATAVPFDDSAWTGSTARVMTCDVSELRFGEELRSGRERVVPAGPLTGYTAAGGEWSSANANIVGGASFSGGRLPASPSSVTFSVLSKNNVDGSPTAFATHSAGIGWTDSTSGPLPSARFIYLAFTAQ